MGYLVTYHRGKPASFLTWGSIPVKTTIFRREGRTHSARPCQLPSHPLEARLSMARLLCSPIRYAPNYLVDPLVFALLFLREYLIERFERECVQLLIGNHVQLPTPVCGTVAQPTLLRSEQQVLCSFSRVSQSFLILLCLLCNTFSHIRGNCDAPHKTERSSYCVVYS